MASDSVRWGLLCLIMFLGFTNAQEGDDTQCTWIAEGGFFKPDFRKPCYVCYCYGGKAECRDIKNECDYDIKCPDGDIIVPFGECCPICKTWAAAGVRGSVPTLMGVRDIICTLLGVYGSVHSVMSVHDIKCTLLGFHAGCH